jgi:hypothetical protein
MSARPLAAAESSSNNESISVRERGKEFDKCPRTPAVIEKRLADYTTKIASVDGDKHLIREVSNRAAVPAAATDLPATVSSGAGLIVGRHDRDQRAGAPGI